MKPKLYTWEASPAVRSVLLTAKAIGLELERVDMDLFAQEHMTPEYLKLNPQHTVPTLDDNGFILADSHAINVYLITKYAKDDSLYPKDPQKRALIDEKLHFDSGMYVFAKTITKPIFRQQMKQVPEEKINGVKEAYGVLEQFLEGNKWMAGDDVSVADLQMIASIGTISIIVPVDEKEFPKLAAWIKQAKQLPYYSANEPGQKKFAELIHSCLNA